jgi:hypothetical protein
MRLCATLTLILFQINLTFAQERMFPLKEAAALLGVEEKALKEVNYQPETKQWIAYDETQASGSLQHVYLLPEDFKSKDKIITLVAVAKAGYRLIDNIILKNDMIEIINPENNLVVMKNEVPAYSQLREKAYEFYDVKSTDWTFFQEGIKNFPIYSKVKSVHDKCEFILKENKKRKCYKNEEAVLAKELLSSTLLNDQENKTLIEFLKNKDQKYIITNSLISVYKDLLTSEALSEEYNWASDSIVTGRSEKFFFHYTLDVSSKITYFSPGILWWKPSALSVRYGYYPISKL